MGAFRADPSKISLWVNEDMDIYTKKGHEWMHIREEDKEEGGFDPDM